jgi:hypothetical protein
VDARLRSLLAHDDAPNPFDADGTARLIAIVDSLKVLDPACGSGAFPMGVLHRLVALLAKLDPGNARWKQRQLDKAAEIPDATVRERVLADIEQAFTANELGYGRKLYLIENCLYGVDIQPIAVQITKLRFFISLVVDQREDAAAPNRGIRPLPNLETKIVAANTLIGIEKKERQGDLLTEDTAALKKLKTLRERLAKVRDEHFLARTPRTKAKCREEDAKLRQEMSGLLQAAGLSAAWSRQLAAWNPYDQNAHAEFFDAEWMFGLTSGFDVVIGNPPYISNDTIPDSEKALYQSRYLTGKRFDLYQCFIEHGVKTLRAGGVLAMILPNTFLTGKSFARLRAFLLRENTIREVVDLPQNVFENATVDNVLFFPSVGHYVKADVLVRLLRERSSVSRVGSGDWDVEYSIAQSEFERGDSNAINVALTPEIRRIFAKLETGTSLGDRFDVCDGLIPYKTAADADASRYTGFTAKSGWKKLLRGKGIARYRICWQGEYIQYGEHLWCKRDERFFKSDKIMLHSMRNKALARRLVAAIDKEKHYNTDNLINVIAKSGEPPLEFLLALLNSKLINYWYRLHYPNVNINPGELRTIPLPVADSGVVKQIAGFAETVVSRLRANASADTSALEREIDQHVYALYGLTPEEIQIVEGATK